MGGDEGRGEKEIGDRSSLCESRGVRVEEMERLFEVIQVDIIMYEEKCFDVMEDFNARISVGAEDRPNSNGKRLLDLVILGDFVEGSKLQCCEGRWPWKVGRRNR